MDKTRIIVLSNVVSYSSKKLNSDYIKALRRTEDLVQDRQEIERYNWHKKIWREDIFFIRQSLQT
jgi:hypothetical protein